uniref:Uncharacterized protein n=1 Tax=Chromera velia CCMP2878 TaxID=1169474 RepID=A0A0G4HZX2_9ALVE|eukprot:Cvel_34193.t1-p1 / transcript=Cvel_34193.t1 / gene=Cvel_34193 / organism=Chromera_velia_CCMP2878 / gene_product=hypothetical protein / transcript_product=hypothetical protein / location=Cvel_scaffold5785:401-1930(+) / protein_length=510 / sequence_SO=supercontig / SO=protein_coding / is_pseudo=false
MLRLAYPRETEVATEFFVVDLPPEVCLEVDSGGEKNMVMDYLYEDVGIIREDDRTRMVHPLRSNASYCPFPLSFLRGGGRTQGTSESRGGGGSDASASGGAFLQPPEAANGDSESGQLIPGKLQPEKRESNYAEVVVRYSLAKRKAYVIRRRRDPKQLSLRLQVDAEGESELRVIFWHRFISPADLQVKDDSRDAWDLEPGVELVARVLPSSFEAELFMEQAIAQSCHRTLGPREGFQPPQARASRGGGKGVQIAWVEFEDSVGPSGESRRRFIASSARYSKNKGKGVQEIREALLRILEEAGVDRMTTGVRPAARAATIRATRDLTPGAVFPITPDPRQDQQLFSLDGMPSPDGPNRIPRKILVGAAVKKKNGSFTMRGAESLGVSHLTFAPAVEVEGAPEDEENHEGMQHGAAAAAQEERGFQGTPVARDSRPTQARRGGGVEELPSIHGENTGRVTRASVRAWREAQDQGGGSSAGAKRQRTRSPSPAPPPTESVQPSVIVIDSDDE